MTNQLFPENILTVDAEGKLYTTSLLVAKYFGKQHKNVLRDIDRLYKSIPDAKFSWLNFEPRNYLDGRGKIQSMYLLTKDGFSFLSMGFTGNKALQWKLHFINAFNQMELELQAYKEKEVAALRQLRPFINPVVNGTLQGLNRQEIANMIDRTPNSVSYHRSVARRLGLLPDHKH